MRKIVAVLLALMLSGGICAAFAEQTQKAPDYIMEGFDGDSATRAWENNLFFSRMQEKTGISFQFRQHNSTEGWTSRKQEIAAGTDLPDVLFKASLSEKDIQDMYAAGVLIDLKPYLAEYAPDLWALLQENEAWMKAVTLPDGAIPALPGINTLQNNNMLWINTSWLKNLKLDMPASPEELTETLRRFRDGDPNRNGQKDEIPLSFLGMWELRFLGQAYGMIDNDYYVTLRDGKVTSSLMSEENRSFLTWLHQLWEENLLDHNGFNTADSLRQITDEKAAIPYGAFFSISPSTVVPAAAMDQFEVVQPFAWNGKTVYRDLLGDVIRGTFAVTSACAKPEKLVSWVNTLYTEEGARMAQYGLEGEEYVWEENGTWNWNASMETVANVFLQDHTIGEGGVLPGISDWQFQKKYANDSIRKTVEAMEKLKSVSVIPYPPVYLNGEDRARIAELQYNLSDAADRAMACFVTGDVTLDAAHWTEFCEPIRKLGLEEMIQIWQKAVD